MGIRKTIYLPDEATWASIRECAEKERRSISNYLVGLHLGIEISQTEKVFKQAEKKQADSVLKEVFEKKLPVPKEERIIKEPAVPQYTESKVDRIARINKELSKKRGNSG